MILYWTYILIHHPKFKVDLLQFWHSLHSCKISGKKIKCYKSVKSLGDSEYKLWDSDKFYQHILTCKTYVKSKNCHKVVYNAFLKGKAYSKSNIEVIIHLEKIYLEVKSQCTKMTF